MREVRGLTHEITRKNQQPDHNMGTIKNTRTVHEPYKSSMVKQRAQVHACILNRKRGKFSTSGVQHVAFVINKMSLVVIFDSGACIDAASTLLVTPPLNFIRLVSNIIHSSNIHTFEWGPSASQFRSAEQPSVLDVRGCAHFQAHRENSKIYTHSRHMRIMQQQLTIKGYD